MTESHFQFRVSFICGGILKRDLHTSKTRVSLLLHTARCEHRYLLHPHVHIKNTHKIQSLIRSADSNEE